MTAALVLTSPTFNIPSAVIPDPLEADKVISAAAGAFASVQQAQQFASAAASLVAVKKPSLTENITKAEEAVKYVLKEVPVSPNYLERLQIDWSKEDCTMSGFHGLSTTAFELAFGELCFETFDEAAIQKLAEKAEECQMGTCLEMSAAGYQYVKKKYPDLKVEIFSIEKGNHVFLVIGRDPKSKPEDYKNWGSDAVVCDPWGNKFYPAAQLEKNLNSFKELRFEQDGTVRTILSLFEPGKQKLVHLPGLK
jgi:hypothetical protein